jgi:hypothetical protein
MQLLGGRVGMLNDHGWQGGFQQFYVVPIGSCDGHSQLRATTLSVIASIPVVE